MQSFNIRDAKLLIIAFIFMNIVGIHGQCLVNDKPKDNSRCSATVSCNRTTENLITFLKNNWSCIKHSRYNDYYYRGSIYYDDMYYLYVQVEDVDINISEDPLVGLLDLKNKVKTLNIQFNFSSKFFLIPNLILIPTVIWNLVGLTQLSLTNNKIETINLNKFASMTSMEMLNVSYNSISAIEIEADISEVSNSITSIDLSYNSLDTIPNNCFEMFSRLKYLDLSFNKLVNFDILTFEGITQLEELQLSNNQISEIDQNFARFVKLRILNLNNNHLTSLTDLNFRMLTNLIKLNLSSNSIKNMEDRTFTTLKNLENLDLSHNQINIIRKNLFKNNTKMFEVLLCCNAIENIETGAFASNKISSFDIHNNHIGVSVESDTFRGIFVDSLDLSGGNIKKIGDYAFSVLSMHLKYLNLSDNLLESVSKSAYHSLKLLLKLDLSNNNLTDIDYDASDLTKLSEYYLQKNRIKRITQKMFTNMTTLKILDLSQNKIEEVEIDSFMELANLQTLNLSNNNFIQYLGANVFRGLHNTTILDLSNTRIMSYLNESFYGMISLAFINSSYGQLEKIGYETFKSTGGIKIIDLSYNLIEDFRINTSNIPQLTELYLGHNKIRKISCDAFKNLHLLEKLTLAYNDILHMDSCSFQSSSQLHYLELFSNMNLQIKGDIFNKLVLSKVSMRNVKRQFSFQSAMNASITTLILSDCNIDDLNSIFIYKLDNVMNLDLSSNKIVTLDKNSFRYMNVLDKLDLSLNRISTIQPGTFLHTNMINILNLHGNNLEFLQFGTLDGLNFVHILNLSNNAIHTFSVNLLHSTPFLKKLSLENNNLASIDFEELSTTSVEVIYIGGNILSCQMLANLKKKQDSKLPRITAEILDFHSENVDGLSCRTLFSRKISDIGTQNTNITDEIRKTKETVDQLYNFLRLSHNESISKIAANLDYLPSYFEKTTQTLNNTQELLKGHLSSLLNEIKDIVSKLVLINTSKEGSNNIKTIISLLERNNELAKLGNTYKEVKSFDSSGIKKELPHQNQISKDVIPQIHHAELQQIKVDESTLVDVKVLLYFISICLGIIVVYCMVMLIYKYSKRNLSSNMLINHSCDSSHIIENGIEMENH